MIQTLITSCAGMTAIGAAMIGYFVAPMNWIERILFIVGGLLLVDPGTITDIMGIGLLAVCVPTSIERKEQGSSARPPLWTRERKSPSKGAPKRGSPRSGLKANEKGSQHGGHAGTLFLCAFYRRIYERSLTAAESRSLSMLTLRRSTLGAGAAWHSRPQDS